MLRFMGSQRVRHDCVTELSLLIPLDLRSGRRDKQTLYKTGNSYHLKNYGKRVLEQLTSIPKMNIKIRYHFGGGPVKLTNINLKQGRADDRAIKWALFILFTIRA